MTRQIPGSPLGHNQISFTKFVRRRFRLKRGKVVVKNKRAGVLRIAPAAGAFVAGAEVT